ncbi:MAG: pectin esterase [Butyrivibrio sp.]|nr:pectin esterase [Butyrivibrio sp.]
MLQIRVGKENADFTTIGEAILAVPYEEAAEISIEKGIYREKIFCDKRDITFIGDDRDETVIEFGDGAFDIMPDGSKRGTFRSYTAFFAGKRAVVKNLTIRNIAGPGEKAGQALAVYADSEEVFFENVKLEGYQDTLFMSPLPVKEREAKGFMGPRVLTERTLTKQYYKSCEIIGDVDFIFGGADAVFDDCTIVCRNRQIRQDGEQHDAKTQSDAKNAQSENGFINGYITAGCGLKENLGMVFRNCDIRGEKGCAAGSVFLGRPWRDEARAVFINCTMDETIAPKRFSGWGAVDKVHPDVFYGEYGTAGDDGEPADLSAKNTWVKDIDDEVAGEISILADAIVGIFE